MTIMFQYFVPLLLTQVQGLVLVMHQEKNPKKHITIDSIREFRELTEIKIKIKRIWFIYDWWRSSKKFYSRYCYLC